MKAGGQRNAIFIERGDKQLSWSWNDYQREAVRFAKSLNKLKVTERSAVAIMGFNSPEWVFSFLEVFYTTASAQASTSPTRQRLACTKFNILMLKSSS